MQIRDLSQPMTSAVLNESMAKSFGYKLNLEQFNDVQLEDVRNKLRTEMSQFEVNESFDALHENPKYQKTRALLDVINQAILEREIQAESANESAEHEAQSMQVESNTYYETLRQKAKQHSVPEAWIDNAIHRMELGESDEEELTAELTLRYDLSESQAQHILFLSEGEAEKAEIIMATKDMVGRITGWLEDVAAMKAEQLLELLDSIRETSGNDVAQQYQDAVKPALEAVYTALETSRQGLSAGLSVITGGQAPMMGSTPGGAAPGMEPPMGGAGDAGGMPPMPGAGPAAGGEDDLAGPVASDMGREKRESVDYSRRLGMLLNSKKK